MVSDDSPLKLLQRLDLVLASRATANVVEIEDLTRGKGLPDVPSTDVCEWVAGVLALRGLLIVEEDVQEVRMARESRLDPDNHEYLLIGGMIRVYERILSAAEQGCPPAGWAMVDLFKEFTRGVARFGNNSVRRDMPWDAILYVQYPDASVVSQLLDNFTLANSYTDHTLRFNSLHPVRRAFRILWLFARIAPFPDFNLSMAWVAMNQYLVYQGYPMLNAESGDREFLHRTLTGPVPLRVAAFESRLLNVLESRL